MTRFGLSFFSIGILLAAATVAHAQHNVVLQPRYSGQVRINNVGPAGVFYSVRNPGTNHTHHRYVPSSSYRRPVAPKPTPKVSGTYKRLQQMKGKGSSQKWQIAW